MVAPEVQGIDLFKIANRSISGWIPSLKTGTTGPVEGQINRLTFIKRSMYGRDSFELLRQRVLIAA